MSEYLLGAFEARGSINIQTQSGRYLGRITVDSATESERLGEAMGTPTVQRNFTNPIYRYVIADRERGLAFVRALMKHMPTERRLNELMILQAFYLADSREAQQRAMDKLRAARISGSSHG